MSVLSDHYAAKSAAFYQRYYKQLEGATIDKFIGMAGENEYEQFPTFTVTLSNGQCVRIEVSRDPEGNGGGFLFGLLSPDMSDWTKKTAVIMSKLEKENA